VRYLATAEPQCAFEIAIGEGKSTDVSKFAFAFAPATLGRHANSDCTAFLAGLAPTLAFKGSLPTPAAANELKVTVTILGTHQSRSAESPEIAGAFSASPAGDWTATKLFLADGEGEVFLNLNATEGIGEFSIKDEDYAETVITELAKILLPRKAA